MKPWLLIGALAALLPVMARAADAPCTPAATLFGKTICMEQLQQGESTDISRGLQQQQGRFLQHDPAAQKKAREQQTMKTLVWRLALIQKFGKTAVNPTQEEIDRYRERFEGHMDSSYNTDKQVLSYVKGLLGTYLYDPGNKKRLEEVQKSADLSTKMYEERRQHAQAMPKEYRYIVDNAESQIAANMFAAYKQDKALYDAYGGAMASTPVGGLQPVEAYRKFYAYIETEGHFKTSDPEFADTLKNLKAYVDSLKPDPDISPAKAAHYFGKTDEKFGLSGINALRTMKEDLDQVPRLGVKTDNPAPQAVVGGRSLPPKN